ncbi:MAG: hypothetical protein U1D55_03840 [Phycisphaerae bacterium]
MCNHRWSPAIRSVLAAIVLVAPALHLHAHWVPHAHFVGVASCLGESIESSVGSHAGLDHCGYCDMLRGGRVEAERCSVSFALPPTFSTIAIASDRPVEVIRPVSALPRAPPVIA